MSNIRKIGQSWVAAVCVNRVRKSKSFPTKREATEWARDAENYGLPTGHTLHDALERYKPITEAKRGRQAELSRIKTLDTYLGHIKLDALTPSIVSEYRDNRLKTMKPNSVRREMIVLSTVLKVCNDEWEWQVALPLSKVKKPDVAPPRRRGMSQEAIDAILMVLSKRRTGKLISDLLLLSLETGMRLGEMTGIKWEDVKEKTILLPMTKNGDVREVPLSPKAREIIDGKLRVTDHVFPIDAGAASKAFQRAKEEAGFPDVHFHDARSEAATRLSKKLDPLQLCKMMGWRDPKFAMVYYAEKPEDIADRL